MPLQPHYPTLQKANTIISSTHNLTAFQHIPKNTITTPQELQFVLTGYPISNLLLLCLVILFLV